MCSHIGNSAPLVRVSTPPNEHGGVDTGDHFTGVSFPKKVVHSARPKANVVPPAFFESRTPTESWPDRSSTQLFCGVHRLDLIQAPVAAGGVAVAICSVMSTRYPRSDTVTINPGWRLICAQVGSLSLQVRRF